MLPPPLPRDFYQRPTVTVAHNLLGHHLIRQTHTQTIVARIVETEAYCGPHDLGAHTSGGKRTPRNEAMYGEKGHAYIYLIYGMYYCINAVAGPVHRPQAVLIRALDLLSDPAQLAPKTHDRSGNPTPQHTWLRGPGKLCKTLDIDKRFYAADLTQPSSLYIAQGTQTPESEILCTPRIGIDYAQAWTAIPWRFIEKNNPAVSGPPRLNRAGIPLSQLAEFPLPTHES